MVLVLVDPSTIPGAAEADGRWINLTLTPSAGNSVALVAAIPIIKPRYLQASMVSTT